MRHHRFITAILSFLIYISIFFGYVESKEITYNPVSAADYASRFCKTYNYDKYKCFDPNNSKCENNGPGKTDCATFMSQALIDGKLDRDKRLQKEIEGLRERLINE